MQRINTRLLLRVAGGAALFCLVIWMAAVLLLPGIVRGKILELANNAGVDLSGVVIESVGLHGMVVRDVVVKTGNVRAVVPLFQARYSLPGILRGNFNTASVSGSRVEVKTSGKEFLLTDLNGVLQVTRTDSASRNEWVFQGETQFEGNSLDLEARVGPKTGLGHATLKCRELAVASFLKFFDNSFAGLMNGNLGIVARVEIKDWQLQKTRFFLDSKRLHIFYSGCETALALKADGEADGAFESYSLHADVNVDQFEHDRLSASKPFGVQIDMDSQTGMRAEFTSISVHEPLVLTINGLKAQAAGIFLENETLFSANLTMHEMPVLRRVPEIQFSGTAVNKAEGVGWTIEADAVGPFHAVLDEMTFSAGLHAGLKASGVGERGIAQIRIQAGNVRAGADQWLLQFPGLRVDGRISPGSKPAYRGVIQLEKGEFTDKETGIRISGISGSVPYTSEGHIASLPLSVDQVDFSGIKLQKIQAEAFVSGRTAIAAGSADLPDGRLKLRFNATVDSGTKENLFHIDFEIPKTDLGAGSALGRIIPALAGFKGGGGIGMLGEINLLPESGLSAMADITLTDVDLASEQIKLNVSGLSGTIRFDRLHELRTLPSQILYFKSLSLGPAKILDGRVQAQLDGLASGLMERLDFAFSGGRVTTTAFRFPAQDTGMEIDFICDRLQLADLLNMITGKSNASGEGTISGVLPVRIGSDGIHFKEAHLATSPGDTGIIRVVDAADMTGGILLAEESIRDFSYEWAKVNIEDSEDHLNMVVKLSGKPRRKLPLKYDPAKRDFVRDPSGERLVDLKGLLLELKFVDIDLNALLREWGLQSKK